MPININEQQAGKTTEPLKFDRVFLKKFNLYQEEETSNPTMCLSIEFQMVAVLSDGSYVYDPKNNHTVVIEDLEANIAAKAAVGDFTMYTAFQSVEQAIAGIIAEHKPQFSSAEAG